jgi:DNA polymerase-3 subunit delta'
MYLCDSGREDDGCNGCGGWSSPAGREFVHPDLIVAGTLEKAANIDACRALIRELALKPVTAKRRLGAFPAADKLLPSAANSLLKTAEEPPSHACILFLMEGDDFLPALRSRSRFTVLTVPPSFAAGPMPANDGEWLLWLERLKGEGKEDADISACLFEWASYAMRAGRAGLKTAARIEKLRLLIEQKKLSQSMVCDLLILTFREDLPFEHTFGGIW